MHSRIRAAHRAALIGAAFSAALSLTSVRAEDDHTAETEAAPRRFTPAEMTEAGIVIAPVAAQPLPRLMRAPGEIRLNGYTSSLVSPRVGGIVVARHVQLGARVTAGQPILRLFSVGMAEAQSAFVLAHQEHARLTGAGRTAISRKELEQAFVALQEARARLLTYGLVDADLTALERSGLASGQIGQFEVRAPQAGVIVTENFRDGEVVEAGKAIAEIGDGATVWIVAMASPSAAAAIKGDAADFSFGADTYSARLVHISPVLNEATRTVEVRLEAANADGALRPGAFVDVRLYGDPAPVLAVPTEAVLRSADGDWAVQVEHEPGVFESQEIEPLYAVGDMTAIAGIEPGTRIVVKGAFFIAAEAAKSGFDAHAH